MSREKFSPPPKRQIVVDGVRVGYTQPYPTVQISGQPWPRGYLIELYGYAYPRDGKPHSLRPGFDFPGAAGTHEEALEIAAEAVKLLRVGRGPRPRDCRPEPPTLQSPSDRLHWSQDDRWSAFHQE